MTFPIFYIRVRLIKFYNFRVGALVRRLLADHKERDLQKYNANVFHTVRQQPEDQYKRDSLWSGKMKSKWEHRREPAGFPFKVNALLHFMEGYQRTGRKIRLADIFVNCKSSWDYL